MANLEKKKQKLRERISTLEEELRIALTQKSSNTKEINLPEQQRKIQQAKLELKNLG